MTGASTLDVALTAHAHGIAALPAAADGTKRPMPNRAGVWEEYKTRLPREDELRRWFAAGYPGIGFVTGAVSGNLELFEFEGRAVAEGVYDDFVQAAEQAGLGDLVRRVFNGYFESTPSGGIHVLIRCTEPIGGSTKLARRPATIEELEERPDDKIKVLIETKGEPGYSIAAPSNGTTHPTGRAWELVAGGIDSIAVVTPDELRALHDLARTFDQMPQRPAGSDRRSSSESWITRPGDDYAAKVTWADILEPEGWTRLYATRGGNEAWRRPGKDGGVSATINEDGEGVLYVFTSSTAFEPNRGYGKFSAYVTLRHNGDAKAAVDALIADGYGVPRPDNSQKPATRGSVASDGEDADSVPLLRRWTMAELVAEPDDFVWTVKGLIVDPTYGQVAGEMKSLKTYLIAMMQVGLAAGVPILGQFEPTKPRPVVAYVGEGGRTPYKRRLLRIARAMGVRLEDIPLYLIAQAAPIQSDTFACTLARDLAEIQPALVTLDPLYAYHGAKTSSSQLHEEGALLTGLSNRCLDQDASLLVVNHMNQTGAGRDLKRITGAGGGEWVDSWVLTGHRDTPDVPNGQFKLWLEVGSRQWGGTGWDLDLSIGRFDEDLGHHDGEITWNLSRSANVPAVDKREERDEKTRTAILDVLLDMPYTHTKTEVLAIVGGNREDRKRVFDQLADDDIIRHEKRARTEAGTAKTRPLWAVTHNPAQPSGHGSDLGDE